MTLSLKDESKREREFSTMVAFSSALSFGILLAIAQATRVGQNGVSFKFSLWTLVAFLAGFNGLFGYLRFIFICGQRTPRLLRGGGLLVLLIMAAGALIYPLRGLGVKRFAEQFAGLGVAVCFITIAMTMVWRSVRLAEREEERQEAEESGREKSHGQG